MGSCVSLHNNKDSSESALKPFHFGSKTEKQLMNDPPMVVATDAVFKSQWSQPPPVTAARDFGSKEEIFFDSQPWLESDCEDDFFSVNGDFTPSRGNTPVHHSFSVRTPGRNGQIIAGRNGMAEPSPTEKKKRLSELFKDKDSGGAGGDENQDAAGDHQEQKGSVLGTLKSGNTTTNYVDSGSSQRTPNGDLKAANPHLEKMAKQGQCCMPRLRSLSERKKRTTPCSP